jgi:hypothetical protein
MFMAACLVVMLFFYMRLFGRRGEEAL